MNGNGWRALAAIGVIACGHRAPPAAPRKADAMRTARYPEAILRANSPPGGMVILELAAPEVIAWAALDPGDKYMNLVYFVLSDRRGGAERVDLETCRARAALMRDVVTQRVEPLDPAIAIDVDACANDRAGIVHVASGTPTPADWLRIETTTNADGELADTPIKLDDEDDQPVPYGVDAYALVRLAPGADQPPDSPPGFGLKQVGLGWLPFALE